MARFTQFALYAAEEAIADSGFLSVSEGQKLYEARANESESASFGVIVSSGIGGFEVMESEHSKGLEKGFERVSPFFIPMVISNMAAARIAIQHGLKGICTCPVTACAGGSNAIGDAFHRIRDGYETLIVCGGTEASITPLAMGGFSVMKALSHATNKDRASIPFDQERNGFVMGEGSGILVLEEREHAIQRNAKIYAEIVGYGTNCDAYHITAPSPNGEGGAACMNLALQDASVSKDQIDYINAHGTSTHMNDLCETEAIKTTFGAAAKDISVSSIKSMTGHLLGAAGGVECIATALAVENDILPPTINYEEPDDGLDLDYVPNAARSKTVRAAISNSFGFGGTNSAIIVVNG